MENFNDSNLDSCIIVTNKLETHRDYVELLFESKKRTGGDEIKDIYYDSLLKQFIISYINGSAVENVLNFGDIIFSNQTYQAYTIDKTRIILENIDCKLQTDVINLYIDHLFQDIEGCEFKLEVLRPGCLLVSCNKNIDFNALRKRHTKHGKLQNKLTRYHYLPLLQRDLKNIDRSDIYRYFYKTINEQNNLYSSLNNEEIYIQNTPESIAQRITEPAINENFYRDKIKSLERKLRLYESLNENITRINKLSEHVIKLNGNQSEKANILGFGNSILLSNNDNESLPSSPKETKQFLVSYTKDDKILYQNGNLKVNKLTNSEMNTNEIPSEYQRSNLIRVRDSFQKYLIEENRKYEQENDLSSNLISVPPKSPKNSKTKSSKTSRFLQPSNSSCTFTPIVKAKSCQNISLINRFPIIRYQKPKCEDLFNADIDTGENFNINNCLNLAVKCSICLEDLTQNEEVRILSCFHQFHVKCIDTWLSQKSTCPTCKLDLNNISND